MQKNPFSSFMRLVAVTQPQGSMERENYKQCNCSTSVNTCKISLIFNNPKSTYIEIERAGERFIIALYSNKKKEESSLNKMSNRTACSSPFP
ncbi:hypothetical protein AVEN_74809-1 [Araneus ventricosus]|uniref:Uncharacterized protein n=1 Tax=Araneus ventricosus TaxID=182803 RepID=A0A4Y2HP12_ARAVE|nr:hypothetical protein AVEN_74809-1 [Araneus ventricosus]